MRVLVCGGRTFGFVPAGVTKFTPAYNSAVERANSERSQLARTLSALPGVTCIIHGAAHGADELADMWAKRNFIEPLPFRANWYPNGRSGGLDRSAGPRRNARMLTEGKPDLVIAFAGGKGTQNMIDQAIRAGVPVKLLEASDPQFDPMVQQVGI